MPTSKFTTCTPLLIGVPCASANDPAPEPDSQASCHLQAIPGVPALPAPAHAADGDEPDEEGGGKRARVAANPATWVLDISKPAAEQRLDIDFAEVYAASGLARWGSGFRVYPQPWHAHQCLIYTGLGVHARINRDPRQAFSVRRVRPGQVGAA